ncbi:MAG: NAD(P)H-dependent oxidoreductase [Planctomycetes bacterium]|nr:NAD(P)H-dependent oxidoreductase [Planctomycetota bacterium]
MSAPKVLVLAGSLRRDSLNKRLARFAAREVAEAGLEATVLDLKDFPLAVYDGDDEAEHGVPEAARRLREAFVAHQGLVLACPEYNGSISGALKNAIDWISRPDGDVPGLVAFRDTTALLLSASPGALGGLRGLVHVRAILSGLGVLVLPGQHAVSRAHTVLGEDGSFSDERGAETVRSLAQQLVTTLGRLHAS